jgi:hypothetical protein
VRCDRADHLDVAADLNDEDETGFVWAVLDEARDPTIIVPNAIVVAGDADAPAVVEVIDIVRKEAGDIVHLRILPGTSRTTPRLSVERSCRPDQSL